MVKIICNIVVVIVTVILNACNSQTSFSTNKDIFYYKFFDIFRLQGIDPLKNADKENGVEVLYHDSMVYLIKYYTPSRTVTLILEDSLNIDSQVVYRYSTTNFHGGKSGKQRIYAFHYEEHKDILYISKDDTILCQTENVPKDRNFSFNLFVKKSDGMIDKISRGEFDYSGENTNLSEVALYLKWIEILKDDYKSGMCKPKLFQQIPE